MVNVNYPKFGDAILQGLDFRSRMDEKEREERISQAMESVSGDKDPMNNDLFSSLPIEKQNMIRQGISLDANLDANQQKMRYNAMFKDFKLAENLLDNGLEAETVSLLQDRAANTDYGQDTAEVLQAYQSGGAPALKKYLNAFNSLAGDGKEPSESRAFKDIAGAAGLKEGSQEYKKAAMIKLGMAPREVGSASMTLADDPDKAAKVAEVEARITGRKKEAELVSRLKLEPRLEAGLKHAVAQSAYQAEKFKESKSNENAFNVYQTGTRNLADALGATETGTLAGLVPAITSNAKVAEGAIAIMAPIIKDVVRSAGEGTWTDADQALVNNMIPTRKDSPEAISMKMKMLDEFIIAKLKINTQADPAQPKERDETSIMSQYGL